MQPYFLPYIGYWQLIKAVDKYVIYDDVNYIKGGWINRNNFLINSEKRLFTILLNDASPNKRINEITIKDDFRKFLKMVQLSYSKAPYYNYVMPLMESVCHYDEKGVSLFLYHSMQQILSYLDIHTELILSSEIQKNNNLKGQDKILEICSLLSATEYINAEGGQVLYDRDTFQKKGIKLRFLECGNINYKQWNNKFISNLSILDVLMFNSKQDVNILLDNFSLI